MALRAAEFSLSFFRGPPSDESLRARLDGKSWASAVLRLRLSAHLLICCRQFGLVATLVALACFGSSCRVASSRVVYESDLIVRAGVS